MKRAIIYSTLALLSLAIGEKLIKTAMDFARQNSAKFIELSTAVDNYTAQSLYEQIGLRK